MTATYTKGYFQCGYGVIYKIRVIFSGATYMGEIRVFNFYYSHIFMNSPNNCRSTIII